MSRIRFRPGLAVLALAMACTAHRSPEGPFPPHPATAMTSSASECHFRFQDSTRIYAESEVDDPPRLVKAGSQVYPPEYRTSGASGFVVTHFVIGPDGLVVQGSIQVDRASHDGFIPSATQMLEESRFSPALIAGQPVPVCVYQRINYEVT